MSQHSMKRHTWAIWRVGAGLWGLFAGLAIAFAMNTAQAQVAEAVTAQQFTLANGLTLIVKRDPRAPTAVHMLWVRVGSMDEVDGSSGLAHVLEHLMFKGTPSVPAGEFSRRVAALGGRENAFTSHDYTGYYQQIPAARLEDVMRLESDRFANIGWSNDEFKKELEVVKEERRMRTEDEPIARLHEALNATVFAAAPYRRPIVGWMSDLDALTADDARDFYQRWYVPANAAVVVVGDVNVQQVRALADKYYGALPARALPVRKPHLEPVQSGLKRLEFKAPAEQGNVVLAFKVPSLQWAGDSAQDGDALALTVLAAVLDGYQGARLERALTQGADRLAESAGADNGLWGRGPQLFMLVGVPAAGKSASDVERALRAQVQRIARDGVTEPELARVKTQWVANQVYKRDSLFNQARELGTQWVQGWPVDADTQLIEQLRAVTAEQVKSVAGRYFGDDQLTVAHLLPQPVDAGRKPRAAPAGLRH